MTDAQIEGHIRIGCALPPITSERGAICSKDFGSDSHRWTFDEISGSSFKSVGSRLLAA